MDKFYTENNILTVKHIYTYRIGLFMFEYVNKMTPGVFGNISSSISCIHHHDTISAT